ncbi:hypothetical protein ACHAWO_006921 [Cyclotella atomus]|uniref:Uncharacterized protein n=1 Tax=Cyclotella atomus TaxID=382360 RepID=A0ABD3NCZ4_9STRA
MEIHMHLQQLIKSLLQKPSLFIGDDFRYLREFITTVEQNCDKYPRVMGDECYDEYIKAIGTIEAPLALSKGYIKALSRAKDTSLVAGTPTIQIVARDTFYQRVGIKRAEKKLEGHTQITQLKLCDGNGNTMFGRLATHLAGEGRKLKQGDIIKITSFTELTHRMGTSTAKPALFILGYSHVGYARLPDDIHPLLCCELSHANDNDAKESLEGKGNNLQTTINEKDAACTHDKRLCSLCDISMLTCICKTNPVEKLDLNTIRGIVSSRIRM